MCCLFGLLDYGHTLTEKQRNRMISALARECEVRGTDATGVAYNSGGKLCVYKRPLPAHKMKFRIPADAYLIMGHTRMTTQGSEKKNCNNHPFLGRAGDQPFALAHNGVIYNDLNLRREKNLPRTKIQTDSYIAVQLIEQKKALDFASLAYMAEQVEGSFSFTVMDERDSLYFVKGDNPLYILHFPKLGCYFYASTQEILEKALRRQGIWLKQGEQVKLDCGDLLRIDSRGQMTRSHFNAERLYQCRYYYGFGYYPAAVAVNGGQQEYVDSLKAVANAYGYTPSAIDRMIAHGFSPEEIEEFLYCGEM